MFVKKKSPVIEAKKYKKGLEDGFQCEDKHPYVNNAFTKSYVKDGQYILYHKNSQKTVVTEEKLVKDYDIIEIDPNEDPIIVKIVKEKNYKKK